MTIYFLAFSRKQIPVTKYNISSNIYCKLNMQSLGQPGKESESGITIPFSRKQILG